MHWSLDYEQILISVPGQCTCIMVHGNSFEVPVPVADLTWFEFQRQTYIPQKQKPERAERESRVKITDKDNQTE